MKKIIATISVAILMATSCEEFQPVWNTGNYSPSPAYELFDESQVKEFTTIADLKTMYEKGGVEIKKNIWIKGQVISSDQSGNIYRSLYIQDATGGLEVKVGKSSLYSDYKLGQWLYINCNGLFLGDYYGMRGLGAKSADSQYETAYIDVYETINTHIFRGKIDTPVAAREIDEAGLKSEANYGCFVTIKGLQYEDKVFTILYDNTKADAARIFIDEDFKASELGIDTWSWSKQGCETYYRNGFGGKVALTETAPGSGKFKGPDSFDGSSYSSYIYEPTANSGLSHYFKLGSTELQIRTSGYCKFADTKTGLAKGDIIDVTGILTIYNKSSMNYQFTLIDVSGVKKRQ